VNRASNRGIEKKVLKVIIAERVTAVRVLGSVIAFRSDPGRTHRAKKEQRRQEQARLQLSSP
jgi:hypothetical protein